jgi:hypothetical protein
LRFKQIRFKETDDRLRDSLSLDLADCDLEAIRLRRTVNLCCSKFRVKDDEVMATDGLITEQKVTSGKIQLNRARRGRRGDNKDDNRNEEAEIECVQKARKCHVQQSKLSLEMK